MEGLDRLKPDTAKFWGRSVAHLRRNVAAELMHGCGACAGTPAHLQKHKLGQKAGPKILKVSPGCGNPTASSRSWSRPTTSPTDPSRRTGSVGGGGGGGGC